MQSTTDQSQLWQQLISARDGGQPIEVEVTQPFSKGLRVCFNEVGGILPASEFLTTDAPPVGKVKVVVLKAELPTDDHEFGVFVVSQKDAVPHALRQFNKEQRVSATITFVTDGFARAVATADGFSVSCFIPRSGLHHRFVAATDVLKRGQQVDGIVTDIDERHKNIVLDLKGGSIAAFAAAHKPGDELNGKVKAVTAFGAFIDLGTVEALLHVGQIPAGTTLNVGQELKVWFAEHGKKGLKVTLKSPADDSEKSAGGRESTGDKPQPDGHRQADRSPKRQSSGRGDNRGQHAGRQNKRRPQSHGRRNGGSGDYDGDDRGSRARGSGAPRLGKRFTWLVIPAAGGTVGGEPSLADVWPK